MCWPRRGQGRISTLPVGILLQGWQDPSTLQREKEALSRVSYGNKSEETLEFELYSFTAGSHPGVGLWLLRDETAVCPPGVPRSACQVRPALLGASCFFRHFLNAA